MIEGYNYCAFLYITIFFHEKMVLLDIMRITMQTNILDMNGVIEAQEQDMIVPITAVIYEFRSRLFIPMEKVGKEWYRHELYG